MKYNIRYFYLYFRPQQSMKKTLNPKSQSFACHICDKRYSKKKWLMKHESTIHAERQHDDGANDIPISKKKRSTKIFPAAVSQETNRSITLKSGLKPKMEAPNRKSSESHTFSCNICDKRYLGKSGLRKHIHQFHVKRRPESTATGKENLSIASDLTISESHTVRPEIEL